MEKIGYALLAAAVVVWLGIVLPKSSLEFWPDVLFGMLAVVGFGFLLAIVGFGFLFVKALSDRISNKEDDHYSKNVDK